MPRLLDRFRSLHFDLTQAAETSPPEGPMIGMFNEKKLPAMIDDSRKQVYTNLEVQKWIIEARQGLSVPWSKLSICHTVMSQRGAVCRVLASEG